MNDDVKAKLSSIEQKMLTPVTASQFAELMKLAQAVVSKKVEHEVFSESEFKNGAMGTFAVSEPTVGVSTGGASMGSFNTESLSQAVKKFIGREALPNMEVQIGSLSFITTPVVDWGRRDAELAYLAAVTSKTDRG